MTPVTERFVGRISATAQKYRFLFLNDPPVGSLDPKLSGNSQRATGDDFEQGIIIFHYRRFHL